MKNIQNYILEGWPGIKGENAYDAILEVWQNMSQEEILNMIWSYFSADNLENLYKWMKQDGYFS